MCGLRGVQKTMIQCVDAHHHLWPYSATEYGWIGDEMPALRRDFLPLDLSSEMVRAGVQSTIAVQARQTLEETRWLLSVAHEHEFIAGVVGWAPIASTDFPKTLDLLLIDPKLKGLGHVLQDEPDDAYMLRKGFQRGIGVLEGAGLVYDLLIYERHLSFATQLVDLHPKQVFILDHIAKPTIRAGEISPWREHMRELAQRPNVHCNLSDVVTEADWTHWSIDNLRPYVDVVLECSARTDSWLAQAGPCVPWLPAIRNGGRRFAT